jgi:methionyl aminopeptidase
MEKTQDDWIKAGKITAQAREFAKTLIKKDAKLLEITEKVEEKIYSLGAKPAFPTQLSLNNIAAHYNALINDTTILKDDMVKVDIGAHINGAIGDTALTVDLSKKNSNLVKASEEALKAAIDTVKPGVEIRKIGQSIHEVITSYGFSPIRNLCGHGLDKFQIHDAPTIPNFDNGDTTKLEEGQLIAIEPFATTGIGVVKEGKPSEIYQIIDLKPVRNQSVRKIMHHINQEYEGLPFSKRWLMKKFKPLQVNFALALMEREKILHQYPQLTEKGEGLVSQTEHSIRVGEGVLT